MGQFCHASFPLRTMCTKSVTSLCTPLRGRFLDPNPSSRRPAQTKRSIYIYSHICTLVRTEVNALIQMHAIIFSIQRSQGSATHADPQKDPAAQARCASSRFCLLLKVGQPLVLSPVLFRLFLGLLVLGPLFLSFSDLRVKN